MLKPNTPLKSNTYKHLSITTTLLPWNCSSWKRSAWAHGVTTSTTSTLGSNGFHSISGWFKVALGGLSKPVVAILLGGGDGSSPQSQGRSVIGTKSVPRMQGGSMLGCKGMVLQPNQVGSWRWPYWALL